MTGTRHEPLDPGQPVPPPDTDPEVDPGRGSTLRRKVGRVAAASTVALLATQILSVTQTVALARLLEPADVGYFAAGSLFTSFVTFVVEGGLRSALIQREDRIDDAAETVFRATLVAGGLLSLLALAASPLIGLLFDSRTAGVVAASMSGGILLFSLTNVPEALLQREFSVRRRLVVGPAVALAFAVTSVTLAALGLGVWSLVIGSYVSTVVMVVLLWVLCDWRPGRGRADRELYVDLFRFGLPLALSAFVDQLTRGIQGVVTGRVLGISGLGLYRYGDRIAQIPVAAIIEIASNSLFPAYSRMASDPERLRSAFLRALSLVVMGGAVVTAGLVAAGEPFVVVVLGEKWRGAGVALVALSGMVLGTALSTSNEVLKGVGRTALMNWTTAMEVVLGIGLVAVLTPRFGLTGAGLAVSTTAMASGVVLLLMARAVLGVRWSALARALAPFLVSAAVAGTVVYLLETELFRSDERPIHLGLALLALDGLALFGVYAGLLRLLAPAQLATVTHPLGRLLGSRIARLRKAG